MHVPWQEHRDGLALPLHVTPRARANAITGLREGRLCVKVTAVPEDGKANAAVIKLLAKSLGLAPSRLEMISGATSRDKLLLVRGAQLADLPAELAEA